MTTTTTTTITTNRRTGAMATTTTSRRGKVSTATSVLLLCAALLLTQSWGAMAFSAIVRPEAEVAQADALIDTTTTTVAEGSGWDTTILTTGVDKEQEQTTEGQTDVEAETTTTEAPLLPEISTEGTDAPAEEQTTTEESEITTSNNNQEADSTSVPTESSSTTTAESETTPAATEESTDVTTTVDSGSSSTSGSPTTVEVETTTIPVPTFECQSAGNFAHISGDCSRYHSCLLNAQLGQLELVETACPELTIFSPVHGRCVRDLSSCQSEAFECLAVGRFAGSDDTYYYSCLPSLLGGFHKFIVRCSTGQRFEPLIGGCWRYDWTQLVPGQEALEASDLAAIKQELKLYKAEDKLRKKALKNQEKLARKQQKLLEKAAKKAAKEEAKKKAKAEKEVPSVESAEESKEA
ncbi:uncharacterized protein Mur18B [Drosophila tropicalis]|uniref:uncharacterized protein Mur18B n=1 Tax=Drosophila tropicalis TaxID=46794 RepID=UPI0035AB8231